MKNMKFRPTSRPADVSGRLPMVRSQRMVIISGILPFVLILVVLQLWLITASMNSYLGGDESILWPAGLASLGCFGLNVGLLRYLYGLERR